MSQFDLTKMQQIQKELQENFQCIFMLGFIYMKRGKRLVSIHTIYCVILAFQTQFFNIQKILQKNKKRRN